jgi:hypothetical protein
VTGRATGIIALMTLLRAIPRSYTDGTARLEPWISTGSFDCHSLALASCARRTGEQERARATPVPGLLLFAGTIVRATTHQGGRQAAPHGAGTGATTPHQSCGAGTWRGPDVKADPATPAKPRRGENAMLASSRGCWGSVPAVVHLLPRRFPVTGPGLCRPRASTLLDAAAS